MNLTCSDTGSPRTSRCTFELTNDATVTHQHRKRVTGVGPMQDPRLDIETTGLPRNERTPVVFLSKDRIDGLVDVVEGLAFPAGVSIATNGERRENRRMEAVTHRVHEGKVELRAIQRIVKAVPADLIRGFEHSRDRDAWRLEREWRQEVPLHTRRERHRLSPTMQAVEVADPALYRQRESREHAQVLALRNRRVVDHRQGERQNARDVVSPRRSAPKLGCRRRARR